MARLQEAQSQYILEGAQKVQKWSKRINEANKILTQEGRKPLDLMKQTALAKVLENTQQRINYELREATQNFMVGPYKRYALDIITGMFPNLIAMDLVNVQPLENKVGIINYVRYSAGSNKAPHKIGDEFASTFNYIGSDKNYTAQEVGETQLVAAWDAAATTATIQLTWKPVIPGSVKIVMDGVTYVDHGDNKIYQKASTAGNPDTEVTGSAINYATGIVTIKLAAQNTEAPVASWFYNNEYAPAEVPELNMSIESIMVTAHSRKLKALWSFDAAYELQKEYGQDLNAMLAAQAAAEIGHEIDVEILDDLLNGAYTSASQPIITWDAEVPYGVSQAQHFESLRSAFNKGSNRIYQNTKRAVGNFVVVGTNVATVLESTPSFNASDLGSNIGPYYLGDWGGFKVYKNPFYDADSFVVGYKGDSLFDAGYCYAPYYPVATTQMLMLASFEGQQGWATSYGKVMLNPYMYASGKITNFA